MIQTALDLVRAVKRDHREALKMEAAERRIALDYLRGLLAGGTLSPARARLVRAEIQQIERQS